MDLVDLASKLLALASGLLALTVAVAGLTTGSRRRRLEAYYKSAADDERSRSPEREAILRSLQREAVGWSVADQAVSKWQIFIPLTTYAFFTLLQFSGARFIGEDIVAGRQVWFGPLSLANPDTPIGGVLLTVFFTLAFLIPMSSWAGYYFTERRRIAREYLMGVSPLVHIPAWQHYTEEAFRARLARGAWYDSMTKRQGAPVAEEGEAAPVAEEGEAAPVAEEGEAAPVDETAAFWEAFAAPEPVRFLRLKVAAFLIGSAALATQIGLTSAGGQVVIDRVGGWLALGPLIGAPGLLVGLSLTINFLVRRAFRRWQHPVPEPVFSSGQQHIRETT